MGSTIGEDREHTTYGQIGMSSRYQADGGVCRCSKTKEVIRRESLFFFEVRCISLKGKISFDLCI